jgi:predicted Zn-dependent protease
MSTPLSQAGQFKALVEWLGKAIRPPEQFTLGYNGEASEFIRFNKGKVRQAGQVQQASLSLKLIHDGRHADVSLTLAGESNVDKHRLAEALQQLRDTLPLLPVDPYLLLNAAVRGRAMQRSRDSAPAGHGPGAGGNPQCVAKVSIWSGFYASGPISYGYASSEGAFGWHQANSFNFDWSLFHSNGQAVKASYAGADWDSERFARRMQLAREQLGFLDRPLHALAPGEYRAYLAPAALEEVMSMLCWGGFSAQALASKSSPLQKLYAGDAQLSPLVSFDEQVSQSLSPAFSGEGYPRQDLSLVKHGKAEQQLVSSRSAAEYGLEVNGAPEHEAPSALAMAAGTLEQADILKQLGTGLYISNLWYLNYSDQPAARLTGMTRFATFWVENGEIKAPVNTMRFDDSVYSLLGSQLEALTAERELLLSASTYDQRQTASNLLPGALIKKLTLTL